MMAETWLTSERVMAIGMRMIDAFQPMQWSGDQEKMALGYVQGVHDTIKRLRREIEESGDEEVRIANDGER